MAFGDDADENAFAARGLENIVDRPGVLAFWHRARLHAGHLVLDHVLGHQEQAVFEQPDTNIGARGTAAFLVERCENRDHPEHAAHDVVRRRTDIMGGMFGVISILAALYQKRSGATGADIRIGLFENCLFLVAQHMVEYEMTGVKPRSMPEREHAWPIYDIFETAGGERIFIGVVTEGHWQSFCREFCLSEFLDDPNLRTTTDRILARSRIIPRVTEVIKHCNAAELSAKLDRLNICFSPINRPEDLFSDPHVLRPGGLVNNTNANGEAFRVPALPIEWNGASIGEGLKVPVLGADTSALRSELEDQESSSTGKTAARLA